MQYAFVTLALTAATMAMPTKREALLSSVDNVANVDAITSGLPVVSGLNLPVKREALLNTVDNVANVDAITSGLPIVSGLNLPVKRDVTSDATKSVTELLKNVGVQANVNDLNVKRGIVDNTLSGTVGNVKDTVNGVKVGVQARDLVNGLVGGGVGGTVNGVLDTVGGLNVAKRAIVDNTVGDVKDILHGVQVGAQVKRSVVDQVKDIVNDVNVGVETKRDIVNNLVDSLGLDQTIGDLDVIKRDLMAGTVSPLLNTVTGTVDGLGLNVKRDSGSVLGLGSGTVGSVTGNSDKSDETLNLGSGTVGDLTEGLNVAHTLGNVLKRQESGSVLGLGSGTVGSVVGNSDKSDETLNLGSGTAGGLTDGLNLNHVVGNILKRQESGSVLGLGSGTVGGVVGNSEKSDETLNLGSGLVGSLTEGLNANHVVENVVKRQSGDVLGLASGTVGGVVGQSGNSDETLNLGSGAVGSLTDGLNVNKVVGNVVKRQEGYSGHQDAYSGAQEGHSGDVLGLASGTVGGVVGGHGDSSSVLDLKSGTVGELMAGLNLNHIVEGVVKRSIQELDVHDLIASLSDEQIKQLTASLPTSN